MKRIVFVFFVVCFCAGYSVCAQTIKIEDCFFNKSDMEFPVFYNTDTVSTYNDTIRVFVGNMCVVKKSQYKQCIIDSSYASGDTLFIILGDNNQIVESSVNYTISLEKYRYKPRWTRIIIFHKGMLYKKYILINNNKEITISGTFHKNEPINK